MIFYDQFLRVYGLRKLSDILKPRLYSTEVLGVPKQAILHYYEGDSIQVGPPSDDFMLKKVVRPIYLTHVTDLTKLEGIPRKSITNPTDMISKFHAKHRRFVKMRSLEISERDASTVVMYNYNMLPHMYRYIRSPQSAYFEWSNIMSTMFNKIEEIANASNRQQFLVVKLPLHLPRPSVLQMVEAAKGKMSRMSLNALNSHESLFLMEMWKWLGEHRELSMINHISTKNLSKVNLIFMESGKWTFMNLGMLNGWRAASASELAKDETLDTRGIKPLRFQKMFLFSMMSITRVRNGADEDEEVAEIDEEDDPVEAVKMAGPKASVKVSPVVNAIPEAPVTPPPTSEEVVKNALLKPLDVSPPSTSSVSEVPVKNPVVVGKVSAPINVKPTENKDINQLDTVLKLSEAMEKQIDADLDVLETLVAAPHDPEEKKVVHVPISQALPLDQAFMKVADRMADNGVLSAADYRRYEKLSESYKEMDAPDGVSTMEEFIQIPQESLAITASPTIENLSTVTDKSMLKSSLLTFDSKYISEVMQKDVASMALHAQNAGIAITGYNVEKVDDVAGAYNVYTVKAVPVDGVTSTWRWKLPILDEEGVYRANDVKYRMRKQRGEVPIRKVSESRVALTSYYGKSFIDRSDKKVNDYGQWLQNQIMIKGLTLADTQVTNLSPGDVFDASFKSPRVYSAISLGFRNFSVLPKVFPDNIGQEAYNLNFDHTKREALFGKEVLDKYEKDGMVVFGSGMNGTILLIDDNNTIYAAANDQITPFWTIETLLGIDAAKAPVDFVELRFLGKSVPVAVVIAYEIGLTALIGLLRVHPRRVPVGTRVNLLPSEYALVFNDETLVFSRDDRVATIVLAGFNEYHRTIREFDIHEFDRRGVYLNLFDRSGLSVRYLREIDLMYQMFIDPITLDLLKEMKEPTDFRGLMIRSAQLLVTDQYPQEILRTKGYERMAGAVYSEMIRAIRTHNGKPGKGKHPIDMDPHAVWRNISTDPSNAQVSDINPIQNLKEMEAVTWSGTGGRSTRSMVKRTRIYQESDMGVISESTVDSGTVGVNIYLSGDPQFTSLRGLSRPYDFKRDGATSLISTSALLSPGSDNDDPKRVNFIAIQNAHGVSCQGYHQMSVRTGYESVIAHRTGDMFATTAKKPGKVVSVTPTGIIVEFDDGETKGVELGRRFGDAAGLVIPHELKTDLKLGQVIKPGDVISYNSGFFEKDTLNPKGVVWKAGLLVQVALMESTITFEDSSAISKKIADQLTTKITKVKEIVVRFDQTVHKLVKVSKVIEAEDILCIIEDPTTASAGLFDDTSLDTLRLLSAQAPQAKVKGVVERIEVYYNGDKEDMSDSLRAIANESDKEMVKRFKSAGKTPHTGLVTDGFRVDGNPLLMDTMVLRIYMTSDVSAGVGDKGVFCNQMKTVFGKIMEHEVKTESGVVIEGIFGQKSIDDRIVLSPSIIGTTNGVLGAIAKKVVAAYRS